MGEQLLLLFSFAMFHQSLMYSLAAKELALAVHFSPGRHTIVFLLSDTWYPRCYNLSFKHQQMWPEM